MAKLVQDAAMVNRWVEEKQQLEVMLAWDLLERFNTHQELIGPLRKMASYAIREMRTMPRNSVDKAILEESGRPNMQYLNNQLVLLRRNQGDSKNVGLNMILKVHSQADLQRALEHNPVPDAQYCSDIIRLYGTCIEQAKKDGYPVYEILNKQKDALRKGGPDVWNKGPDEKEPEKQLPWGRHRVMGASFQPESGLTDVGLFPPDQRSKIGPFVSDSGQFQVEDALISKVHRFLIYQQGGQSGIELRDSSTVGKIDRVFGTVPAGDVSGTTADTLFFFNQFKRFLPGGAIDPIFYLLPAATIVALAHHSLVEVAWALSLNHLIEYHIGYYKTLMPESRSASTGTNEIKKTLDVAENHQYNHRMLIFYNGPNKCAGCFKFENPLELEIFKARFSKVNDVAQRFRSLPAWPTKADIQKTWTGVYQG
jgi:hypothetical protein